MVQFSMGGSRTYDLISSEVNQRYFRLPLVNDLAKLEFIAGLYSLHRLERHSSSECTMLCNGIIFSILFSSYIQIKKKKNCRKK